MEGETAYKIVQEVDGETYTTYMRSEDVAGRMIKTDPNSTVTAIGYEDTRSEWDKSRVMAKFGDGIDTDIDAEAAVDALNLDLIAEHLDEETAEELERVGTNWNDVSEDERVMFIFLFEKLQRMSRKAERLLNSKVWRSSRI